MYSYYFYRVRESNSLPNIIGLGGKSLLYFEVLANYLQRTYMNTMTRREAHALGLKRFFTGIPCRKGHLAERYVTTNGCVDCLRTFSKMPPGATSELKPMQPPIAYLPRGATLADMDALNDYLAQCVVSWVTHTGLMTDGIKRGYEMLARDTANKRRERDAALAHRPTGPLVAPTIAAKTELRSGIGLFLDALAVATGKDLDKMTLLARQAGEPDVAFRIRIRAETLKNTGV